MVTMLKFCLFFNLDYLTIVLIWFIMGIRKKIKGDKMIYLLINNKIKFNITTLNNKELLEVVGQLENHDIKVVRIEK